MVSSSDSLPDDHELWESLSSGKTDRNLGGLSGRLQEDNPDRTAFVNQLCDAVRQEGFAATLAAAASNNSSAISSTTLPVAFETSSGKYHLEALTKFVGISKSNAVNVTLMALAGVDGGGGGNLQSLLGTQNLFHSSLETYFQQRTARLGSLMEILLLEVNDDGTNPATKYKSVLEELNQDVKLNDRPRGLFTLLLHIALAPQDTPLREQFLPLQKFGDENFLRHVLELRTQQRMLERQQALEALLTLLYSRTLLQADCSDLAILVMGLQNVNPCPFFAGHEKRLACLAGLLCVEVLDLSKENDFFQGREAQLMANMTMNLASQVDQRRSQGELAAPESLLLLAVGLTLKKSEQQDVAMQCLQLANDCGAFEYLQFVVDTLLPRSLSGSLGIFRQDESNYLPNVPKQLKNETAASQLDASKVIYTTVSLELLGTVVLALQDFLSESENVAALCHLGACLYANDPVVCQEFWGNASMNKLLEASYTSISAFWELAASVCFDEQSVCRLMERLPSGHVHESLLSSGQESVDEVVKVTEALSKLAKFHPVAVRNALSADASILFQLMTFHATHAPLQEASWLLLSSLMKGSLEYAIASSHYLSGANTMTLLAKYLRSKDPTEAFVAASLFESLVSECVASCFAGSTSEAQSLKYIEMIVKTAVSSLESLCDIFAFSRDPKIDYHNVYLKITGTNQLVSALRVLSELHKSSKVQELATQHRQGLLEMFATSTALGQALAYFAVAPVSLSIGLMLEYTVEEAKLLETVTDEYAVDDATNPLGKWHSMLQKKESPLTKLLNERLSNLKSMPLDLARIQDRGWARDESVLMHVANSAIALLSLWTMEAEDLSAGDTHVLSQATPFILLSSSAVIPPHFKALPNLAPLWPTGGLSTYDILVYYLEGKSVGDYDVPLYAALQLLTATARHADHCGGFSGETCLPTSPLYGSIESFVSKATDLLSTKDQPSNTAGIAAITQGQMIVQLLNSITKGSAELAEGMMQHNEGALSKNLIQAVHFVASDSNKPVPEAKPRLAFAAECLRALNSHGCSKDVNADIEALLSLGLRCDPTASDLASQAFSILSFLMLKGGVPGANTFEFCEDPVSEYEGCVQAASQTVVRLENYVKRQNLHVNISGSLVSLCTNKNDAETIVKAIGSQNDGEVAKTIEQLGKATAASRWQFESIDAAVKYCQVALVSDGVDMPLATREKVAKFVLNKIDGFVQLSTQMNRHTVESTNVFSVVGKLSDLLLHLAESLSTEAGVKPYSNVVLIGILNYFTSNPKSNVSSLNNLLAVSAIALKANQDEGDNLTEYIGIIRGAFDSNDDAVVRSSLALLSILLQRQSLVQGEKRLFVLEMRKHNIVASLVTASTKVSEIAVKDEATWNGEQVDLLNTMLVILSSIVNLGEQDSQILTLFDASSLGSFLIRNPLFRKASINWIESGDDHYRGYLKSPKKRNQGSGLDSREVILSGQNDRAHSVWCTTIKLVTSLARLGSRFRLSPLVKVAHDFLNDSQAVFKSSLVQCGSVLTLNLLHEVWNVVELLSALPDNSDDFLDPCLRVICSLSKFMGAIGTAKLLFQLVGEVASDQGQILYQQLLHPSFANGIQNAKFEAVRYAHTAQTSFDTVTSNEHELDSDRPSTIAIEGDDLERTCKAAIGSKFCKAIETSVAKVMLSALTFVTKKHPAAQCFVPFSVAENRNFNPRSIVSNGCVIAAKSKDGIIFGHVESCDTVRRTWTLSKLDSGTDKEMSDEKLTISFDDLAGVEDTIKRRHLFHYAAAPDTARELTDDKNLESWTIGHLILILRWCRFYEQDELCKHVSEGISTLLATELALHSTNGSETSAKESTRQQIDWQLYDLFGSQARQNLTNKLSPPLSGLLVSRQLHSRLHSAGEERQKKQQELEARNAEADPWYMNY